MKIPCALLLCTLSMPTTRVLCGEDLTVQPSKNEPKVRSEQAKAEYKEIVLALANAEALLKLNSKTEAISHLRKAAKLIWNNPDKRVAEENKVEREQVFAMLEKVDDQYVARRKAADILNTRANEVEASNKQAARELRALAKFTLESDEIPNQPLAGWEHLDTTHAKAMGDFLRIDTGFKISTRKEYYGNIEIRLVARTDSQNIRINPFCNLQNEGPLLILNWEVNPRELRLRVPNSLLPNQATKCDIEPLKPNVWYEIVWRISEKEFAVSVDGKQLLSIDGSKLFTDNPKKKSPFVLGGPIFVSGAFGSVVDVRSLSVKELE